MRNNLKITGIASRYFESKTDSYKNNKRKIYRFDGLNLIFQKPYKTVEKNGISFGFTDGEPKQADEETLSKYYKELTRNEYFEKEITHIICI